MRDNLLALPHTPVGALSLGIVYHIRHNSEVAILLANSDQLPKIEKSQLD